MIKDGDEKDTAKTGAADRCSSVQDCLDTSANSSSSAQKPGSKRKRGAGEDSNERPKKRPHISIPKVCHLQTIRLLVNSENEKSDETGQSGPGDGRARKFGVGQSNVPSALQAKSNGLARVLIVLIYLS